MSEDVVIRSTMGRRTIVGIGGFPDAAVADYVLPLA
jgi:hypothetical protein